MSNSQHFPNELDINIYHFEKLIIFNCDFFTKVGCIFLLQKTKEISELNTQETGNIFQNIDQMFQEYRYKAGISLFA